MILKNVRKEVKMGKKKKIYSFKKKFQNIVMLLHLVFRMVDFVKEYLPMIISFFE